MQLEGKVALVTGGSRGIGRGIVEAYLNEGASVALSGRSQEKGDQALKELDAGERAIFFASDAMNKDAIEKLIDDVIANYGRLDIVVNNAGGATEFAPLAELSDEAWHQAIDWNLNSTFYSMRKTLAYMIPRQSGRIINISSLEGKNGKDGLSAYSAMKHAINGLTKSAAREVGTQGITVNAICPGLVMTDAITDTGAELAEAMGKTFDEMMDMFSAESAIKRPCTPEEVAAMAVLLASDASSGITGALLSVDGGTANY